MLGGGSNTSFCLTHARFREDVTRFTPILAILVLSAGGVSAQCPTSSELAHLLSIEGVDLSRDRVSVSCEDGMTVTVERADRRVSRRLEESPDRPGVQRLIAIVAAELVGELDIPPVPEREEEPEARVETNGVSPLFSLAGVFGMPATAMLPGHGASVLAGVRFTSGLTLGVGGLVTVRRLEEDAGTARATHGSTSLLAGWTFGTHVFGQVLAGWSVGATRWNTSDVQPGFRASDGRVGWTGLTGRISIGLPLSFGALVLHVDGLVLAQPMTVGLGDEDRTMRGQLSFGIGLVISP